MVKKKTYFQNYLCFKVIWIETSCSLLRGFILTTPREKIAFSQWNYSKFFTAFHSKVVLLLEVESWHSNAHLTSIICCHDQGSCPRNRKTKLVDGDDIVWEVKQGSTKACTHLCPATQSILFDLVLDTSYGLPHHTSDHKAIYKDRNNQLCFESRVQYVVHQQTW